MARIPYDNILSKKGKDLYIPNNAANNLCYVIGIGRPKFRGYTFIAQNAPGFDNYILLEYFVKQGITPSITMRGSRVIFMYNMDYDQ